MNLSRLFSFKLTLTAATVLLLAVPIACSGGDSPSTGDTGEGEESGVGDGSGDGDSANSGDGDTPSSGDGDAPSGDGDSGTTGSSKGSGGRSSTGKGSGGSVGSGGTWGMGGASMGGATSLGFPTLGDYIPCNTDYDCPNSLDWECIKSLSLNHADLDGRLSIEVSMLDDTVIGVCSRDCSQDKTACYDLNLDVLEGSAPFSCQVVWTGESPYPEGQLFPFDDAIEASDMDDGVAFAALCRPPLELDGDRSATFCAPCSNNKACGPGEVCFDPSTGASDPGGGTGICSASCIDDGDCAFGFECEGVAELGTYCVPLAGTCSACRDLDGDGRGVGHCEETAIDCDDTNAEAYWDSSKPLHPFPDHCGDFDYNCNGKEDSIEILDPNENGLVWGAMHCGACGSSCVADDATLVKNGSIQCVPNGNNGVCKSTCDNTEEYADCDGNIQNGCETEVSGALYYPDSDKDGYGDDTHPGVFPCGEAPPSGWVINHDDCDDTKGTISPDATEVCDNVDNDCEGGVDDLGAAAFTDHYPDLDGDGYGDENVAPVSLCVWAGGGEDPRGDYAFSNDDCDDTQSSVNPGVTNDKCDTKWNAASQVDSDCDGNRFNGTDQGTWHLDADGDRARAISNSTKPISISICVPVDEDGNRDRDYVGWGDIDSTQDCDDEDSGIYPSAAELCDGIDNDCSDATVDGSGEALWGTRCILGSDSFCNFNATYASCDGNSLVCVASSPVTSGDTPGDGFDEDCDGFDEDVESSVYLIPGSNDGGNGTQAHPYNTLETAMTAVSNSGGSKDTIIIGRDLDTGTELSSLDAPLSLVEGMHILGGYEADGNGGDNFTGWTLSDTPSVIRRNWVVVNNRVGVVRAKDIDDETILANVQLTSVDPSSTLGAGQTAPNLIGIGLFNAPDVHLINVEIALGNGQDGGTGSAGVTGTAGQGGNFSTAGLGDCESTIGTIIVSGGNGNLSTGASGSGLHGASTAKDAIYSTSSDLSSYGFKVGDAGVVSQIKSDSTVVRSSTAATLGLPGSGGGAGNGSVSPTLIYGGGGGAGGCGGTPGTNGGSGSNIYGIYIVGDAVDLSGVVSISAGHAGAGGAGGQGGQGGAGGTGATGGNVNPGGDGSGGLGGGGGGGGWGGDNILVFAVGASSQVCPSDLDTSGWGCPGEGGAGASSGDEGARPNKNAPTPWVAADGHWGWKENCFVGETCTTAAGCSNADETCAYIQLTKTYACVPSRAAVGSNICSQ